METCFLGFFSLSVFFQYWLLFRSQFQLYLAVKSGKFGFQLFQFLLLLPRLARYLLLLRYLTLQHLVLFLVLLDNRRDTLQRIEEVQGGGMGVRHRQMPVVVGVLVVTLHHEAVVSELQTFFECPLADHLYRKAVKFTDSFVQSTSRGDLGDIQQTHNDDLKKQ